jgi:hypothetical protein
VIHVAPGNDMTNGLRSAPVRGSRRCLRVVARSATATALVVAATVIGFSVSSGDSGRTVAALANATIGAGGEYHALTPARILDTRDPNNDVAPFGRKATATGGADSTFDVPIVGRGGLPAFVDSNGDCADDNVLAVAVNITLVDPPGAGWVQSYGKGAPAGTSSLINFKPHETVPNTALLRPGCDGQLTLRIFTGTSAGSADVVIDVFGWISSSSYGQRGARLEPVGPGRIFDSREAGFGAAPFTGGEQRFVPIRGATAYNPAIANIVPNSADAVGVLVNVTVVNNVPGSQQTYISLLTSPPDPGVEPKTSNVNVRPGQIRANLAIVPISADGGIYVYNRAGNAHVVIDVMGYFVANRDVNTTRGRVIPLVSPFRAFDTREPAFADQPLPPANAEDWSFTDFANDVKVAGAPVGAQLGLLGNLTAAALGRQYSWATVSSYLTAYPTPPGGGAQTPPLISNLNLGEGEVVPNMVVLSYGSDGSDPNQVRFYNRAGYLDYLLDVSAVILA